MSLISNLFGSKPLIFSMVFSVVVSVFAGYLWMDRENKSILFEKQSDRIVELEKEVREHKNRADQMSEMLAALDEVNASVRTKIEDKRTKKSTTIKGIENATKENIDGNNSVPIPNDIAGMLDEVCYRIRGSTCPTP